MKKLNLTIIILIILGLNDLYSQKIRDPEPEKIKISDLETNSTRSSCLRYSSVLSFRYSLPEMSTGAVDRYFSVKNETFMRILLNKHDTTSRFFILNEFYCSIPEIKNIVIYNIDLKKIVSRNVTGNDSVYLINYFDKGFYLDLSAFKDSTKNKVADIRFTNPVFSKKRFSFCIDSYLEYKYFIVKLDIPEIYKYHLDFDEENFINKIGRPYKGPFIGYGDSNVAPLEPSKIHELIIEEDSRRGHPRGVPNSIHNIRNYCNIRSYIFISKNHIVPGNKDPDNVLPEVINLTLDKINEIGGTTWGGIKFH
jgi:hypothetical protein